MSLLFPAYLLGALGLLLPWILHRFSDHQPPVQLFPSRQFLEPTTPPVSRKRTLRYRLLLGLRVAALLLLCLLFAQPWIKSTSVLADQEQHHLIAVDRSLSMRADGVWREALASTEDLINQLEGASVDLIAFDNNVSVLASSVQQDTQEQSSISDALRDLQPGFSPADYGTLMQRLDRLAADQELPVKVWLVSDMQQSALPSQLNALYAPSVSDMELVSVNAGELLNVHLRATATSENGASADVSVTLQASAAVGDSAAPSIERTVRVASSERVLEERSVALTAGELSILTFEDLVLPEQAVPELTVSLVEPDAIAEDNEQRLSITQRSATGIVLLLASGRAAGNASVFISTALESDGLSDVELIQGTVQQVPPDTPHLVVGLELGDNGVGLDVLQFVDTGGNALVFNQASASTTADRLFEGVGVGVIDQAHPLALGEINWISTRFYDLPTSALQDNDRVLLQTNDGQNVLVERPTNRGRLLIFNDPLDGMASNLPLQPGFVDLMQSIVSYFDASTAVPAHILIGERLALPANVQVINDEGEALLSLADRGQAATIDLEEPGLYSVVSVRGEQMLSATLDPDEANLSRLGSDAMSAWLARYDNDGTATDSAFSKEDTSAAAADQRNSLLASSNSQQFTLWQWLLPLMALLFFAEAWLANRHVSVRRDGS